MSRPLIAEPDLPNRWLSGKRKGPANASPVTPVCRVPAEGLNAGYKEKAGIETVPLSEMYPYFRVRKRHRGF
jgi:hypothetical protein